MSNTNPYPNEPAIPQEIDPDTGLPIGPVVENPGPSQWPDDRVLEGNFCRLEPLDPDKHTAELFAASTPDEALNLFRYLPEVPPENVDDFKTWVGTASQSRDPKFYAVIDKQTGVIGGRQTFLRINPDSQSIEIGNIYWGPGIAGTPVTTEANYLFAKEVFENWGYRRYEWKCNALNEPSKRAALRLGFSYEGHFRRATIVEGRSRDTSWFAMIDTDWERLEPVYRQWLDPSNFDADGKQRARLSDLTRDTLKQA